VLTPRLVPDEPAASPLPSRAGDSGGSSPRRVGARAAGIEAPRAGRARSREVRAAVSLRVSGFAGLAAGVARTREIRARGHAETRAARRRVTWVHERRRIKEPARRANHAFCRAGAAPSSIAERNMTRSSPTGARLIPGARSGTRLRGHRTEEAPRSIADARLIV
jgi:hypothetical protein